MTSLEGIAYRQKLKAGGAGLTILTENEKAVATINKRDGSYAPYGKMDEKIFTEAVLEEAFNLTQGLPYRRLGSVQFVDSWTEETVEALPEEAVVEATSEEEQEDRDDVHTVCSKEYEAIISEYTDKKGNFSYELMNKDFIQRAHKSKQVMIQKEQGVAPDEIIASLLVNKVHSMVAGADKYFTEADAKVLAAMLDDMNMRSAFKELKLWLRGKKYDFLIIQLLHRHDAISKE
jgi:UDP-galactopyranose mutase